jgi:DNA-binding transcriptional LysR family regulator
MEMRQLEYFLAAAHAQNFRQAAELCLVTQPALSRQIAALEKELGMLLFQRVKQHVVLTPAGQSFAEYARSALDTLQQGELEMARWQEGESGIVQIGCNHSLAVAFLPPLLSAFRQQYPAIRLSVTVRDSDAVIKLVERGGVDLGFLYDPTNRSEIVHTKELFRQPMQLLVSPRHPLAQLPEAERTLERITREPLLMMNKEARLRKVLERIFRQHGLKMQPVIEIGSSAGLIELVKQECGVTIIPPALLQQLDEHVQLLSIANVQDTFPFALVYRRVGSLSMPARQFINAATQWKKAQIA